MKTAAIAPLVVPALLLAGLIVGVVLMTHGQPASRPEAPGCAPALACAETPITTLPPVTVHATLPATAAPAAPQHRLTVAGYHRPHGAVAMPYYSFGKATTVADKG
ncbi:MAG TPA: hypothetical protein VFG73_05155 [Rhodanobacteraceae bacterium]|nr:hypothetical protein [Rhodanobacteraceae bacterium]